MAEKTLTVRKGVLDAEARAAYYRAMRFDTTGGLETLDDLLAGAELFEVLDGESIVLRYALRIDERPCGREGVIVIASGNLPGFKLVEAFTPIIERQLAGVHYVRVDTKRKALARKLIGQGYELSAFRLSKRMMQ